MRSTVATKFRVGCVRASVALVVGGMSACSLVQWDILESNWHLDAIAAMKTPPDPAVTCGVVIPDDGIHKLKRLACEYGPGTLAEDTLGVAPAAFDAVPIRHVIIVMKENRSFDHLFGALSIDGAVATEPIPLGFSNPDLRGRAITPRHAKTTCIAEDPDHQWDATHTALANGKMTGFVVSAADSTSSSGHFVMDGYDATDLPFYYFLAGTYALDDRHFAPFPSGTYANRNFLLFATNAGIVDTVLSFPDPTTPSIFRELMNAGFTWGAYTDGNPFSGALDWDHDEPGVHPFAQFLDELDHGTLPNVAFVDGIDNVEDDHPTSDLQVGEAWLRTIYTHAVASPLWDRIAIIYTYDEGGGFADHVPPPTACVARPEDAGYDERGPRVPIRRREPVGKAPPRLARRPRSHRHHALHRSPLSFACADGARREQLRALRHVRFFVRAESRRRCAASVGARRLPERLSTIPGIPFLIQMASHLTLSADSDGKPSDVVC